MKVYLAGSIAGGRKFEKNLNLIASSIEILGHTVVTWKNVVQMHPIYTDAKSLADRKRIMMRDKKWIKGSDIFIAEVSTYSHGVGYEHAYAESLGKPVLLLRHNNLKKKDYSAFLDGSTYKRFQFKFYYEKNIGLILKNFFKEYGD